MPEGTAAKSDSGAPSTPRLAQLNRDVTTRPTTALPRETVGTFDPDSGTTVIEPLGSGAGWWAGAPSAVWTGQHYYLSYRLRRPQPERGGETRIAVSSDGERFSQIWSARKEEFDTPSIERSALVRVDDDHWRLYISYVDGSDGRWRIDLMEAATPEELRPRDRRPVLTAADIGGEAVKDPWIGRHGTGWLMIASYVPTPGLAGVGHQQLHGTRDIYNTGLSKSLSGLATSADGLTWHWEGPIFEPADSGWDAYAARLNTVVATTDAWIAFYDGSSNVEENYEERCGVAVSDTLRQWRRLSPNGPAVGAAGGPGTVRYVDAIQSIDWVRFYYEYTRTDGAHELRTVLRQGAQAG